MASPRWIGLIVALSPCLGTSLAAQPGSPAPTGVPAQTDRPAPTGVPAQTELAGSSDPTAQADTAAPTLAVWREDLSRIVEHIVLLHPDPFTKLGERSFRRAVSALIEDLPELEEEERFVRAMRLVAALGDGHTILEPTGTRYARWYPVRVMEFTDGYYVVSAHRTVADLAGAQVLEVGGIPVGQAAAEARSLIAADNPSAAKERLWALHNAALMRGLGLAEPDGSLAVLLRLADRRQVHRRLTPKRTDDPRYEGEEATFEWTFRPPLFGLPLGTDEDWITPFDGLPSAAFLTSDPERPPQLGEMGPLFARAIPARDAYYVRTNYIDDTRFIPFMRGVLADVDDRRPRALVIDWRNNFGGDGSKLSFLTREFVKRLDDPPWGEIYVLTGPKTFSAAVMAVDVLLDQGLGTVVGEPSAAGLNHFGDPAWRTLSGIGARLSVSTLWHQLGASNDLTEHVPVDVPTPLSFADFVAGRDPALDPILAGEEMRSVPAIAVAEGGERAAQVYRERSVRLGDHWWWRPPSELDLREACDTLVERERFEDALATCRLNSEIHPHVWNVWYNLAGAQRAAGLDRERLASYRCVALIAPNNWNVPAIRELLSRPGNEGDELPAGCPVGQ